MRLFLITLSFIPLFAYASIPHVRAAQQGEVIHTIYTHNQAGHDVNYEVTLQFGHYVGNLCETYPDMDYSYKDYFEQPIDIQNVAKEAMERWFSMYAKGRPIDCEVDRYTTTDAGQSLVDRFSYTAPDGQYSFNSSTPRTTEFTVFN